MKRLISLALVTSLLSSQALAQCPNPVTPLSKGEASPCAGFLFSPEKELELRRKNEEYKLLMEQTKLYIQQIELYKKEIETTDKIVEKEQKKAELWRTAAEDTTKKYIDSEENKGKRDWFFLLTGIGLTVLAGWTIGQAAK